MAKDNTSGWKIYDTIHQIGAGFLGGEDSFLGKTVGGVTEDIAESMLGDRPGTIDPTVDATIPQDISAAPGVGGSNPTGVGLGQEIANVNGKSLSTMGPSFTDGNNWNQEVVNVANPGLQTEDENIQNYA